MKGNHFLAKLALFSIIFFQPVHAFNQAGTVTLTGGGGYDYFSSKRHVKNNGIGFGALGYNFTDAWGIEGLYGRFYTQSTTPATYNQNVSGNMFAANGVYHFAPYHFVQPYLLAGPGVMTFNPNGTDAHNEVNINAAVGVQLFVNEIIAFRFEARDLYTFVGAKNDVFLSAGLTFFINT